MERNDRNLFLNGRDSTGMPEATTQITAATSNRLEALKVLSNSILQEVEALKMGENLVSAVKINLEDEVKRFESDLIRCALVRTGGKQRRAAKLLNVKVTTLNAKIKRLGLSTNGLSLPIK
jgi:DNA-binding NtrC family response regulator